MISRWSTKLFIHLKSRSVNKTEIELYGYAWNHFIRIQMTDIYNMGEQADKASNINQIS